MEKTVLVLKDCNICANKSYRKYCKWFYNNMPSRTEAQTCEEFRLYDYYKPKGDEINNDE